MQIQRLFETVYLLLDRKKVTARELAEHFEVSTRTIYRDLDVLSASGIPVYTNKGKDGGIQLLPHYVFNKTLLSDEEQEMILHSLSSLALFQQDQKELLERLNTLFHKHTDNWIHIDFSSWDPGSQDMLQLIKEAIFSRRCLKMRYLGTSSEYTERTVEPLQLYFKEKSWYLTAYCRLRKQVRFFKLVRIRSLSLTEDSFEPKPMPAAKPEIPLKSISLTLHFDASCIFRVMEDYAESEIEKQADGSLIVRTSYPESGWILGYLLSYGSYVEVMEPADFRQQLEKEIRRMGKQYGING